MSQEQRKASDVLLNIENTISKLEAHFSNQNLLLNIVIQRLDLVLSKINNNQVLTTTTKPNVMVEAVDTKSIPQLVSNVDHDRNVFISSEDIIQVDNAPKGFRRTSRPETFAGDNAYLNKPPATKEQGVKFPTQVPRPNGGSEVVVISDNVNQLKNKTQEEQSQRNTNNVNSVPVKQRVVDGSGKSVFLADVEIFNESQQSITKTRTNGTGKWMASLPVGNYKVVIKKRDSVSKEPKEIIQDVQINGNVSPLEIPVVIVK